MRLSRVKENINECFYNTCTPGDSQWLFIDWNATESQAHKQFSTALECARSTHNLCHETTDQI